MSFAFKQRINQVEIGRCEKNEHNVFQVTF